jgi:E3 ubiquitin-protein ligase TRIP12
MANRDVHSHLFAFTQTKDALLDTCGTETDPIAVAQVPFTLPENSSIELIIGGAQSIVTSRTLPLYMQRVAEHVLETGPRLSVRQFVAGIQDFIPLSSLECLKPQEMELLCHSDDDLYWDEGEILASIVCKHGYTSTSPQVLHLASVMSELTPTQRKHFVQFVTGASRLPFKGFRGLQPPLTVVCKKSSEDNGGSSQEHTDRMLPSCSTCQVYLKLPEYSSRDVLKMKLLQAITEGTSLCSPLTRFHVGVVFLNRTRVLRVGLSME